MSTLAGSSYSPSSYLLRSSRSTLSPYLSTRGRFEVPSLMPRSSSRPSSGQKSYASRAGRSTSGPRSMASSRSSYGTGTSGYGASGYGSSYSSSSANYSPGSYSSPRTSSAYTPTSNTSSSSYGNSSYYSPSTSISSSGYSSSSYTPSHRSYYSSSSDRPSVLSPTPRLKSPVKEVDEESKSSDAGSHAPSRTPSRRFRHRTASRAEETPATDLPAPSLNEQASTLSKDLRECLREEFLLCKICFDSFKNPKSLPCLHTFCLECLNKYMEGYRLDFRKFSCPICRRQVYMPKEGADGFPDSFFVERLRDVLSRRTEDTDCHICNFRGQPTTAKVFCLECKTNLCQECSNGHRDNKVTAKHSLLALVDDLDKTQHHCCETHGGEPVCFFCTQCRGPICLVCMVTDHSGHDVEAIQEVRQGFISECQTYLEKADRELTDLSTKRKKLSGIEKQVVEKKDLVKAEVNAIADNLIAQIQKQKEALLTELDQLFDFLSLESEGQRMDKTIKGLQNAVDLGKEVMGRELEPIEQLKSKGHVLSDLDAALRFEPYNVEAYANRNDLAVQFLSGESEVRLGRLVRTILPSDGSNADPIIEYKAAEGGNNLIQTAPGGAQAFIPKDDTRKQLRSIDALALLPSGELVVLSANSEKRVQIYDMSGMLKTSFPPRASKLGQPTALCVSDGHIAITDLATHAVHVYNQQGYLDHVFGAGVLDKPWAITGTTSGCFVIADPGKTRLTIHTNVGDLLNIVHFQKKTSVPRFLATCGNTIYSVNQSGEEIKAWRFADTNLRVLGVIKVAVAALGATSAATSGILSVATSQQSLSVKQTSSASTPGEQPDEVMRSRSNSVVSSTAPAPFACAGLFADKEGNLFVSDRSTSSVAVFTALSETYMIQLSASATSRPSAIVVTPDDRVIIAQRRADETISGLVETLTGDALNMELVSYTLV